MHQNDTILFFDGVCGLCNGLVDWLLPRDQQRHLKFATLQGSTAKALLRPDLTEDLATVVVWQRGKILVRSEAILACLSEIGGIWKLAALLKIIPAPLRDLIYGVIASNRYNWFGKRLTCRMPLPGERLQFLD